MSQITATSISGARRQLTALVVTAGFAVALVPGAQADAPAAPAGYNQHCLVCHGADLGGVPNLGIPLEGSDFVAKRSMDEMVEFLKVGRLPNDPDSVAGMAMPGFAWMPEDELREIAKFIREPR